MENDDFSGLVMVCDALRKENERLRNTLALHAGDTMSLEGEVRAFQERAEEAEAENRRLRQFVDFVNLWAWRDSKISDSERLSAIKYHPTAKMARRG